MRLYCLPSAGTSSSIFNPWKGFMDKIEVIPIQYPGHGDDMGNKLIDNMDDLVAYIFDVINDTEGEYALLGHSLGAMVAYELSHKLYSDERLKKLIVCACPPPNFLLTYYTGFSKMDDREFIEEISKFGGIPKEFKDNEFYIKNFLYILRNDFNIVEKYEPTLNAINLPITVINGTGDKMFGKNSYMWNWYTTIGITENKVKGDHFFVNNKDEMLHILREIFS